MTYFTGIVVSLRSVSVPKRRVRRSGDSFNKEAPDPQVWSCIKGAARRVAAGQRARTPSALDLSTAAAHTA